MTCSSLTLLPETLVQVLGLLLSLLLGLEGGSGSFTLSLGDRGDRLLLGLGQRGRLRADPAPSA